MSSYEMLKSNLYQLVKNDYGFEIYSKSDEYMRFSFYHLNSCYNAFCVVNLTTGESWLEWQYAKINKKIVSYVQKICDCIVNINRLNKFDLVEKEVNYYADLSHAVFKAKYATEIMLHTYN